MRLHERAALLSALLGLLAAAAPRGSLAEPLFLPAERQGSWTAADKQLHFAGSLALAASLHVKGWDEGESIGATIGAGLLKEIYDATIKPGAKSRGVSIRDLAADVLGAVAGALLVSTLE